jgi:hypothetical protein
VAIIQVGADKRSGHPGQLTLERLEDVPTYRTDLHGNAEVVTDGERYWILAEPQASALQDYLHLPFAQLMGYNPPSLARVPRRLGIWHWLMECPSPHEGQKERRRGWDTHSHGG